MIPLEDAIVSEEDVIEEEDEANQALEDEESE